MTALIKCAALVTLLSAGSAWAETAQPYKGEDAREIASLSEADIDNLLAGRGMGYALPAELNSFPGPLHVLELAEALDLSAEQIAEVTAIQDRMRTQAQALGVQLIEAEAALSAAFAAEDITSEDLGALTQDAAAIEANLRVVHLQAHLEVTPLLTRHQVVVYDAARGYAAGHQGHGGH